MGMLKHYNRIDDSENILCMGLLLDFMILPPPICKSSSMGDPNIGTCEPPQPTPPLNYAVPVNEIPVDDLSSLCFNKG